MIIEVKRLIALKKYVGNFQFNMAPPTDKLILPLAEVDGDINVEGEYEIYDDDSVGVSIKISYKLKGQCSYCLAEAEKSVAYSYEALFVPDKNDADNYYYDGARLNIQPAVDDAFVFSQPEVLLCTSCAQSQE